MTAMRDRQTLVALRGRIGTLAAMLTAVLGLLADGSPAATAEPAASPRIVIDKAFTVADSGPTFPSEAVVAPVGLPDRWWLSHPGLEGIAWYRTGFRFAGAVMPGELLALYVDRACSSVQVVLNGQLIFSGGRMVEPLTRACAQAQLVTLPPALLRAEGNVLDLRLAGRPLERVASIRRAGGLSAIELGLQADISAAHAARLFWEPAWVRGSSLLLVGLGFLMVAIAWLHRREVYFAYFGWLCLGWAALSLLGSSADLPWSSELTEFFLCSAWAFLLACAVQFLLSFAGLRSRVIEDVLALQWVALPLSLALAGDVRRFALANLWYAVLAIEMLAVAGIHLVQTRRHRPRHFWTMAGAVLAGAGILLAELAAQWGLLPAAWSAGEILMPVVLVYVGTRLFLLFAHALRDVDADRKRLAGQLQQIEGEVDQRVETLAQSRVEQISAERIALYTAQERKRIAADLHDDLGAKLLTIVHSSEESRISELAREALEEMRLSVRGLAGRSAPLDEALADWRAEIMTRLAEARIEGSWANPDPDASITLPSRVFMQLTRILREAISNVIRHSGAHHCEVACRFDAGSLVLEVRDDGNGFAADLQRGQGMSTMKRRAKTIGGQCLVESRPGRGVVISLTAPLPAV